MNDPFAVAEHEVEDLLEAAKKLRTNLLRIEVSYRRTLKALHRRSELTATIKAGRFDAVREELTGAIKSFERQRHRARGSVIRAQAAEGQSMSEIGRSWGFSRQLATRYAREAARGR